MSTFSIDVFVGSPSVEYLKKCNLRKDDWIAIGNQYNLKTSKSWKKAQLKNSVLSSLWSQEVLPVEVFDLFDDSDTSLAAKQLELQYAREKDEKDREHQVKMLEMKLKHKTENRKSSDSESDDESRSRKAFDISKVIRLVPVFEESDPDEFFSLFEKLATSLHWPKDMWPIILQSALKGKGRSSFLALSLQQSNEYSTVKDCILKAYEVTTEHYRSNFRKCKKLDNQTYIEYAHTMTKLHERWFNSAGITTLEKYKEAILLEQF